MAEDKKNKRNDIIKLISDGIHEEMIITDLRTKTHIYLIAVDKRMENNKQVFLSCNQSTPLNGYVYDVKQDAVVVNCANVADLGTIDYAVSLSFANVGGWKKDVPIPFNAVIKLLSVAQLKCVKENKERYPNYEFHFIQMFGCN